MEHVTLGSGDTEIDKTFSLKSTDQITPSDTLDEKESAVCEIVDQEDEKKNVCQNEITAQMIDDNEAKLKERIAQCRNIIESLKLELNEEKSKLESQSQNSKPVVIESPIKCTTSHYVSSTKAYYDSLYTTDIYSESVESKLSCDKNLVEYEKQLQKYQNTLNMAQIEKKNAIRKQMLTKAYRLKLLEVENQCNIELLRVKQSLQCLKPLQIIASKWKSTIDIDTYDTNNFELIPRHPELNSSSNYDMNICRDALDNKLPLENGDLTNIDCVLPD